MGRQPCCCEREKFCLCFGPDLKPGDPLGVGYSQSLGERGFLLLSHRIRQAGTGGECSRRDSPGSPQGAQPSSIVPWGVLMCCGGGVAERYLVGGSGLVAR